jgi:hypothetical protein
VIDLFEAEVILRENLPTAFTAKVSLSSPKYYIVLPSSEFNRLKETLWDNESIDITAVKQENGDTHAFSAFVSVKSIGIIILQNSRSLSMGVRIRD